jgi:hypothetical protein
VIQTIPTNRKSFDRLRRPARIITAVARRPAALSCRRAARTRSHLSQKSPQPSLPRQIGADARQIPRRTHRGRCWERPKPQKQGVVARAAALLMMVVKVFLGIMSRSQRRVALSFHVGCLCSYGQASMKKKPCKHSFFFFFCFVTLLSRTTKSSAVETGGGLFPSTAGTANKEKKKQNVDVDCARPLLQRANPPRHRT